MKYTKDEADQLLTRLEKIVNQAPEFSESDHAALHEMVQAWRGWVALGKTSKWIITSLGLLAAAIASWEVLGKTVKAWLAS